MRPIVNVSEEDRGTDAGNMHKNRACGPGDILADRQTYFATALAGEVTSGPDLV